MKRLLLALVAILAIVLLRHREPDRAVMRPASDPAKAWRQITRHRAVAENVWRLLESQPGFNEGMERARADFAAGRFSRYDADPQPSDPYPASLLP